MVLVAITACAAESGCEAPRSRAEERAKVLGFDSGHSALRAAAVLASRSRESEATLGWKPVVHVTDTGFRYLPVVRASSHTGTFDLEYLCYFSNLKPPSGTRTSFDVSNPSLTQYSFGGAR
eukprot:6198572-Pleurochrysis_carterae.AAC.1